MRPPTSFNTSFLLSTWISLACHAAVIATGFWLHEAPTSQRPLEPVFDFGENAVSIVWRSPVPRKPTPEVAPPEPEEAEPPEPALERAPEPEEPEPPEVEPEPESEPAPEEAPPDLPRSDPPVSPLSIPLTPKLARTPDWRRDLESSPPSAARPLPASPPQLSAPAAPQPSLVDMAPEEPPSAGKPGVLEEARLASRLAPRYPRSCRRRGHEGTVRLECRLSSSGGVIAAKVVKSAGCDKLDRAALDAVRAAHFSPQRVDGRAVAGTIVLPIEFRLR